jgi:hypothetical protein
MKVPAPPAKTRLVPRIDRANSCPMSVTMDIEDYLGEEVVDRAGETVGKLACYWHLLEGRAMVLGVVAEDDSEKTRLVPARGMRMDERHSCIRIPFARSTVRDAPALECDEDLETHHEEQMYKHYALEVPKTLGHLQLRRMTTS